jgi:hypothetical protein
MNLNGTRGRNHLIFTWRSLDCVEGKRKFEELLIDLLFSSLDQATKDLGESKWRYMGSIAISLKMGSLGPRRPC